MSYQHSSERDLAPGPVTPGQLFREGQRCYCLSSSKSSTSSATKAASDNADVVEGGAVTKAGDFSDVQSGGVRADGADTVVAASQGGKIISGVDVAGANISGEVNVTTADPELLKEAFKQVAALSEGFAGTVGELVDKNTAAAAASNSAVLSKLSELAESKQTDGESNRDKTILYIIVIIVLGGAGAIWAWRKS